MCERCARLERAILDIDAKATPYGPDEHATAYVIPAGPLHRALGVVGHSAARGPVPLPPTRERLTLDATSIGMTLKQESEPPKAPTFAEQIPLK